ASAVRASATVSGAAFGASTAETEFAIDGGSDVAAGTVVGSAEASGLGNGVPMTSGAVGLLRSIGGNASFFATARGASGCTNSHAAVAAMIAISVSGIAQRVQPCRAGSVVGSSPMVGAVACNEGDSS